MATTVQEYYVSTTPTNVPSSAHRERWAREGVAGGFLLMELMVPLADIQAGDEDWAELRRLHVSAHTSTLGRMFEDWLDAQRKENT